MLPTTVVHTCRHCGSDLIRKNGYTCNGAQRAKCLEGERPFLVEPAGPRYDQKIREQVLSASQDRLGTRGIPRTFGVCDKTLLRRVEEKKGGPAHVHGHALARAEG